MPTVNSLYLLRCRRCRDSPAKTDSGETAQPSALGWLRVHDEPPKTRIPDARITFGGFEITDGFYAEYISLDRVSTEAAERLGRDKRTQAEQVYWPRGMDLVGEMVTKELRAECRRKHRINLPRTQLINLIKAWPDAEVIYV